MTCFLPSNDKRQTTASQWEMGRGLGGAWGRDMELINRPAVCLSTMHGCIRRSDYVAGDIAAQRLFPSGHSRNYNQTPVLGVCLLLLSKSMEADVFH